MSTNLCLNCNKSTQNLKFCSRSCSASFTNKGKVMSEESRNKISKKLKGKSSQNLGIRKIPRVDSNCYFCDAPIEILERELDKVITCKSTECKRQAAILAGKKSAASRVKRSKDEIKLYELCKNYFTNVKSNYIVEDGWDADIVLPDLKIAIMWNGPWHYKEMGMSNHSLSQVQNRDKIKTRLFESKGWTVIAFEDRYYTPEKAFMVLRDGTAPPSSRYERLASL